MFYVLNLYLCLFFYLGYQKTSRLLSVASGINSSGRPLKYCFLTNICQSLQVGNFFFFFSGCCLLIRVVLCLNQLLGNMGKWDLLLPELVLKELMLDKLLNRYLMITVCSQTLYSDVDACGKVFKLIVFKMIMIICCLSLTSFLINLTLPLPFSRQQTVCHFLGSKERTPVCLSSKISETTWFRKFILSANSSLLKSQTQGNKNNHKK